MNDDGEPAHSAGSPIFGQIVAAELHNVLICVVRYYGGTKLGVGGLIQAYRESARGVIERAEIVTRTPKCLLILDFDYPALDAVMRYISKYQLNIRSQQMGLNCHMEVEASIKQCDRVMEQLGAIGLVSITKEMTF
jgi:putative IMPACT (imprinted ancient) family translation regulator